MIRVLAILIAALALSPQPFLETSARQLQDTGPLPSWQEAQKEVLPLLVNRRFVEMEKEFHGVAALATSKQALQAIQDESEWVTRPYLNMSIVYTIDNSIGAATPVTRGMREHWNVTPQTLHTTALANLDAKNFEPSLSEPYEIQARHHRYEAYLSALLLKPKSLYVMLKEADGSDKDKAFLVIAPEQTVLMATSDNAIGRRALVVRIQGYENPNVSGLIYRLTKDGIVPLVPLIPHKRTL